MNKPSIYQLNNVTKRYDSQFALQLPHLEIERGKVLSLLGPTGAGKSTLLRILSGVERPTDGDVQFEGSALHGKQFPLTSRRRITMIHQRPLLLTGTVKTNVEYGLALRRIREKTHKVEKILRILGLTELASKSVRALSGGQAQLVALARSLVIEPDVLLLDEPTAHLDPARVRPRTRSIAGGIRSLSLIRLGLLGNDVQFFVIESAGERLIFANIFDTAGRIDLFLQVETPIGRVNLHTSQTCGLVIIRASHRDMKHASRFLGAACPGLRPGNWKRNFLRVWFVVRFATEQRLSVNQCLAVRR